MQKRVRFENGDKVTYKSDDPESEEAQNGFGGVKSGVD